MENGIFPLDIGLLFFHNYFPWQLLETFQIPSLNPNALQFLTFNCYYQTLPEFQVVTR